jgi:hypothetical protein
VGCADRTGTTPTGINCDFEDADSGKTVTLELVDTEWELTVYGAITGEKLGSSTLTGSATDCPFVAAFQKGDKQYFNDPSEDDYVNALKSLVAPS